MPQTQKLLTADQRKVLTERLHQFRPRDLREADPGAIADLRRQAERIQRALATYDAKQGEKAKAYRHESFRLRNTLQADCYRPGASYEALLARLIELEDTRGGGSRY